MTAWTPMVALLCLLTKCGVDFLILEYGSKFTPVSDNTIFIAFFLSCLYAMFVDALNFIYAVLNSKSS